MCAVFIYNLTAEIRDKLDVKTHAHFKRVKINVVGGELVFRWETKRAGTISCKLVKILYFT